MRDKWTVLAGLTGLVVVALYWETATPDVSELVAFTRAPPPVGPVREETCADARFALAADENGRSLRTLPWAPFGRYERGWEIYAPLIAHEINTDCGPATPGFADALQRWQKARGLDPDGRMGVATFASMKTDWQLERPFVVARRFGCPDPPSPALLTSGRPGEGYMGKHVELLSGAFEAYRRMVRDARREVAQARDDPTYLTIFSAYRSPAYDAARCARQQNCTGVTRARCSPHRTGAAMDIYVGQAAGYGPDSSADPNRLAMSRTPTYRWLVANARRYGFVNYAFEPWHWEWIGESGAANEG